MDEEPHRATRDVDLLGFGEPSTDRIREVITDVIALDVEDDGVAFDATTLDVAPIREDQEYGGIRAVFIAHIAAAKVRLQVDVGFGDVVTPGASEVELPTILAFPAPRLRAYPRETVVAEKLEALVVLGQANSRMKDFYDLVILSRVFEFDGELLARAIRATFEHRKTPLPTQPPVGLTEAFASDAAKIAQWIAFLRKAGSHEVVDLSTVVAEIAGFAMPALLAATRGDFAMRWPPRGPWQE